MSTSKSQVSPTVKLALLFFISFTALSITKEVNGDAGWIGGHGFVLPVMIVFASLTAWFIAEQDVNRTIKGPHVVQSIFRSVWLALFPIVLIIQQGEWSYLTLVFVSYSTYYLLFDFMYNKLKGEPMFYVGKEAFIDKLVRRINEVKIFNKLYPVWYILLKSVFLVFSLYLAIKFYW